MADPVKLERHTSEDSHGYSPAARRVLGFTAFAITLLPIPILALKILPAYQKHAWFLLFYTPFLCLLTLCYLFYIRDALARVSFADLLDPHFLILHRSVLRRIRPIGGSLHADVQGDGSERYIG
jgi:uncharacterized membrane protein